MHTEREVLHPLTVKFEMRNNDTEQTTKYDSREKVIVHVGIWGIVVNFVYAIFKGIIGLASGSIAIFLDAINNLSDAISSIIAVGGTKLAMKPADKFHPFGHGRIEYVSAMAIAVLIVVVGIMSFVSAVGKIIHPTETHYTTTMLLIMATGVIAKLWLGIYTTNAGKRENSDSLSGSGTENIFDAIITFATIVSALILMIWDIDLDGWFGAAISLILTKAGIDILKDTFDDILGHRVDSMFSQKLKARIMSFAEVHGANDLILNNYGPDSMVGSVNIEVAEGMTAKQIHALTLKIQRDISETYGIYLAVGIYAYDNNPEHLEFQEEVRKTVMKHKGAMQLHGFIVDEKQKSVSFDVVTDFSVKNRKAFCRSLEEELESLHPEYKFYANPDLDYCD